MTQTIKAEQPITALEIQAGMIRLAKPIFSPAKQGQFVSVRKAGEGEKTKLGLYLGDLPLGVNVGTRKDDPHTLIIQYQRTNPAIFVFDDNQIVYGAESWWGAIKSPEHLREITDGDIENVWYVQALKQIEARASEPQPSEEEGKTALATLLGALAQEIAEKGHPDDSASSANETSVAGSDT